MKVFDLLVQSQKGFHFFTAKDKNHFGFGLVVRKLAFHRKNNYITILVDEITSSFNKKRNFI